MKSKKFRYLLICGALFGVAFMGYAWYHGFVPVADGPDRARLRHALNLSLLPSGVSITAAGHESWTDYLFEAEIAVATRQIESLLTGRGFVRQDYLREGEQTEAYRIDGYGGFVIAEHWSWGDISTVACDVWCNKRRDRAFIRFTAE